MLHDPSRAEELVQEAMVKVWRSAGGFDATKGSVSSWIFAITRRTGLDMIRKDGRTLRAAAPVPEMSDDAAAERHAWRHWEIGRLLAQLPAEQRVAVEMFVISGYTHVEVAERLEIPVGTIKTRIYTGLRRLRDDLARAGVTEVTA